MVDRGDDARATAADRHSRRHGPETTPVASASAAIRVGAERGVLIDIGTTTDLVRFGGGRVQYQGYTDGDRLRSEELVYTGAIRTPIMAVAERVPFAGEWQPAARAYLLKACPTPE